MSFASWLRRPGGTDGTDGTGAALLACGMGAGGGLEVGGSSSREP